MSQFFTSGGQCIGASASASVLPMNIQGWFPLELTGLISLQSKGLSRESSSVSHFKSINSLVLSLPYGPSLISVPDYWKKHSFDYREIHQQSMSLFFNMMSRFVTAFLPSSKHFLISWLESPSTAILESKKLKSIVSSMFSPSICHKVMGPDAKILVFWVLSFKSLFFTCLFHPHHEAL